jgi:hypothetical protein
MHSTLKRLAVLAALGAGGIVTPTAGATPAITPLPAAGFPLPAAHLPMTGLPAAAGAFPVTGLPAFQAAPLSFAGPTVGQVAAVIGPTIITTAPSTFNNTNNQVSAGSNASGGQAGP